MLYPSILAHMLNGFLLMLAFVAIVIYFSKLRTLDAYHIVLLVLLSSLAVGVHGLSHLGLERAYNYSPWNMLVR